MQLAQEQINGHPYACMNMVVADFMNDNAYTYDVLH